MLKFEKVMVKEIVSYEDLVKRRLTQMKGENPNKFIYWCKIDEFDVDSLEDYYKYSAKELYLRVKELHESYRYSDLEDLMKGLIAETGVDMVLTDEILDSYDYDDFVGELIAELITVESNIETLCKNTTIKVNLFPMQEENINAEGSELRIAIEALINRYINTGYRGYYSLQSNSEADLDKILNECEVLKKLFNSQGYQFRDIANKVKLDNSPFLNSFYAEIDNSSACSGSFLTVLASISVWDFINNFTDPHKKIVIEPDKDLCLGLFDLTYGTGSNLEVVLERPLSFDIKRVYSQIEESSQIHEFKVDEVYGLTVDCWTKNIRFEELDIKEPLPKEYEMFKLQWMIDHGYTLTDLVRILNDITMDNDVLSAFEEFESDLGFNQALYPCFEEWLNNEKNEEQ